MGADYTIHNLFKGNVHITIHPPLCSTMRAFCDSSDIKEPQDYLVRNRNIVNSTDILVAFTATFHEVIRSGTWATIRYAKKSAHKVIIIYPDGSVM